MLGTMVMAPVAMLSCTKASPLSGGDDPGWGASKLAVDLVGDLSNGGALRQVD